MYDEKESREYEVAPELSALEQQLRGMTPVAPRVDRDRMMFAAGQAAAVASVETGQDCRAMHERAGRPRPIAGPSWAGRRFWPAATFTMTAATLLLATLFIWQNRRQPIVQQAAPLQPAVVANQNSHDADAIGTVHLATRNQWPSIPSVNSGYLGVRYVALTRGIGALSSELPSSGDDERLPFSNRIEPNTRRGLLNELLPTTDPSNSSRS